MRSRRGISGAGGLSIACLCVALGACNRAAPPPIEAKRLITERNSVRRAGINSESRIILVGKTHRFELTMPPRAELEIAFGVAGGGPIWKAWPPQLDRVDFTVAYESEGGRQTLMQRRVDRPSDGVTRWQEAVLDLASLAGRRGALILDAEVHPPMPEEPRIVWSDPRLRTPSDESRTNVILISIDTLRADHLGCYGYGRPTSPNIDRLAGEGILFRNFVASSPWTLPSHASMLTGLDPSRHRAVKFTPFTPVPAALDTLAERLWDLGYDTAGFVGGGFVTNVFRFGQGFDRYWENPDSKGTTDTLQASLGMAKPWMEQRRGSPFFLFLHTYQVHLPYTPPASTLALFDPDYRGPYQTQFTHSDAGALQKIASPDQRILNRLEALYDGEIRAMDTGVGDLLAFLQTTGLSRNTCVLLTSDHGEEFGEHGDVFHSKAKLYEELLHVPLIVWCPSQFRGGVSVTEIASHTDIVPTVLALAGGAAPADVDGRSLVAALQGDSAPIRDLAISEVDGSIERKAGSVHAVRTDQYKLIDSSIDGSAMLFDLPADPGERRDLHAEKADVAREMRAAAASQQHAPAVAAAPAITPDAATRERLRALGYIQ